MPLVEYCNNFTEEFQYILLCGSDMPHEETFNDYLSRIPWKGILSLSDDIRQPLASQLNNIKKVKNIYYSQNSLERQDAIQYGDIWWAFVNGYSNNPDTLTDSYANWRNKYRKFIENMVEEICSSVSPQELMLIVALDTLKNAEEKKKVQYILEIFDVYEKNFVHASIIGSTFEGIETNDLANINFRYFDTTLYALSNYASNYLYGYKKDLIWLPQRGTNIGCQLSKDDEHFIFDYLEIVGDHLLNPKLEESSIKSFYWGEPITWDAISQNLPVDRPEIDNISKNICLRIDREEWGRYNLSHAPGAGASVSTRIVCWNLRKKYPVIRVKNISKNTIESIHRIASITSLPIIILLDGDYTHNEADHLENRLQSELVTRKYVLLYTYRVYHIQKTVELPILDIRSAENFELYYGKVLSETVKYSSDEIQNRKNEMNKLTRVASLSDFRVPFFMVCVHLRKILLVWIHM